MPRIPIMDAMERVPGGMMLIPLVLGSIVGTFAQPFLELGTSRPLCCRTARCR